MPKQTNTLTYVYSTPHINSNPSSYKKVLQNLSKKFVLLLLLLTVTANTHTDRGLGTCRNTSVG